METTIQTEMTLGHDLKKLEGILESLLFASGEAVKGSDLERIMGISADILEQVAEGYRSSLAQEGRGLKLMLIEDRYQLGTCEENAPYLRQLLGVNERQSLSKGALESLSVIAFKQPVTRVEIDEIRGVSSEYVLQKLMEKELIKEVGRKDAPGRPRLYGTTDEFLMQFGFSSLKEMRGEVTPVLKNVENE
ncbi:SMC-Scp complex subunit ScpB [Youngiibacter fragilis]|uniref:Segregation and condensation protein B n=1 Tax=Youngiibacter fragilis 232.1 TaxID=994573 RepID=V7I2F1_9CLOT|nr:SMC-Scp complex subunit ScpB [Youngiibacter fragilis]ETA79177.1 segregation and condensation protein B [Youngiibacter fragilis 232.1]